MTLHRAAREGDTEQFLVDEAARMGGVAIKIRFVAYIGAPDRLVILPGMLYACIGLLELKHPGGRGVVSPQQGFWHRKLRALGVLCEVAATEAQVLSFLKRLRARDI